MKKALFVLALLFPLGLFLYGKAAPYIAMYQSNMWPAKVIRTIPLDDFNHFPPVTVPQMPTLVPPHVTKVIPVKPAKHHYPIIVGPNKPVKPTVIKPKHKPAPPLNLEPETFEEKQPVEFCAFWGHCGYNQ